MRLSIYDKYLFHSVSTSKMVQFDDNAQDLNSMFGPSEPTGMCVTPLQIYGTV